MARNLANSQRHHLTEMLFYLVHLCLYQCLDLFMSYLCDLFEECTQNVDEGNKKISSSKSSVSVLPRFCLFFCQFQLGATDKSGAYKKECVTYFNG